MECWICRIGEIGGWGVGVMDGEEFIRRVISHWSLGEPYRTCIGELVERTVIQ
jgi:hypothetical protein